MATPLMPGIRAGDLNAPQLVLTPKWGPDGYSRRMAVWRWLFGSPFGPQSWGFGPRPAPDGASATEHTKSTTVLAPQQQFGGMTKAIADPALRTLRRTSSFPGADVPVNPVLLAFDVDPHSGW